MCREPQAVTVTIQNCYVTRTEMGYHSLGLVCVFCCTKEIQGTKRYNFVLATLRTVIRKNFLIYLLLFYSERKDNVKDVCPCVRERESE